MPTIIVEAYQCASCSHIWLPTGKTPKQCSKCRSRSWNADGCSVGAALAPKAQEIAATVPGVTTGAALERTIVRDEQAQDW